MLHTNQFTTANIIDNSQVTGRAVSEIDVPIVPSTAPSVMGSDLFYIIIALTIFTKATIEAIALLVKVAVRVKVTEKGEVGGSDRPIS